MQVISTYANTVQALAASGGPYVVDAGTTLAFIGSPAAKSDTQYQWDFGDGSTATGSTATHTYADHGIYVARLTTIVNEPGGVTTRQYARVQVRSVKPIVNAGAPSTCDEGQVVEYTATFTHVEWPETHTATFDFGDDTLPVSGTVTETNTAPMAKGSATAIHAYCQAGVYTVTVSIQAKDGSVGTATRQVTALNLPPKVTARDIFAYRCTPINLIANFTDPGWCDTHTASWDFGDCTPPQPATVREQHNPPEGAGIAIATHDYKHCGAYHAVCVVTDNDGASGDAAITVRVVDVVNRNFEDGFRIRTAGVVANGWEPYVGSAPAGNAFAAGSPSSTAGTLFAGEEIVVHNGRRSQRIAGLGTFAAGIYQRVGANIGWDYQVTAWYSLDERGGGTCRLGVDPDGGIDPTAKSIVWSAGSNNQEWRQLTVRVTAGKHLISIFLEADGVASGTAAYFDEVALLPYPCPIHEHPPAKKTTEACVEWTAQKEAQELGTQYTDDGFVFQSRTNAPLTLVTYGVPAGQAKMLIPGRGLDVGLPFTASRVVATVVRYSDERLTMEARDKTGSSLGTTVAIGNLNTIETLEIDKPRINAIRFLSGGGRDLLIELCAYMDGTTAVPANPVTANPVGANPAGNLSQTPVNATGVAQPAQNLSSLSRNG
ncbi:MAG: PKD domain-containing protein [Candidatus Binataceae bacterium]|jgi:hypothetical protein